jgi:hypothetical protein
MSMRQLLDLGRENAMLKRELAGIRAARADSRPPFDMSMAAPEQETAMDTIELLIELRTSQTDLARFVEAVIRDRMAHVVVSSQTLSAWQRREPQTWEKVADWMAAHDVAVVTV